MSGGLLDGLKDPKIMAQISERQRVVDRVYGGGEFGPAIASLSKFRKHCSLIRTGARRPKDW
jgi:hypothetical protein